jgi:hypothetical protein
VAPPLPALIAVIAGVGGAWIGGFTANNGAQQQFENQQTVREQDLQRAAFADLLNEVAAVHFAPKSRPVDKVVAAEADADLFANHAVRATARALVEIVQGVAPCTTDACYEAAQSGFVDAARSQLGTR